MHDLLWQLWEVQINGENMFKVFLLFLSKILRMYESCIYVLGINWGNAYFTTQLLRDV